MKEEKNIQRIHTTAMFILKITAAIQLNLCSPCLTAHLGRNCARAREPPQCQANSFKLQFSESKL